jgi:ankyrin repeat protein
VLFSVDKVNLVSIHEAARYGDVLELQAMVQRGAGINALDSKFKFTPLHWSALHGKLEVFNKFSFTRLTKGSQGSPR